MDKGKEGTMEKQNNVWTVGKRNARNNTWKETWNWLRKGDLKVERQAMLCTVQEQIFEQTMRNTR